MRPEKYGCETGLPTFHGFMWPTPAGISRSFPSAGITEGCLPLLVSWIPVRPSGAWHSCRPFPFRFPGFPSPGDPVSSRGLSPPSGLSGLMYFRVYGSGMWYHGGKFPAPAPAVPSRFRAFRRRPPSAAGTPPGRNPFSLVTLGASRCRHVTVSSTFRLRWGRERASPLPPGRTPARGRRRGLKKKAAGGRGQGVRHAYALHTVGRSAPHVTMRHRFRRGPLPRLLARVSR